MYCSVNISMCDSWKPHRVYCKIVGIGRFLSSKINIEVDFGQYANYFDVTERYLVDEKGKKTKYRLHFYFESILCLSPFFLHHRKKTVM